MGFKNALLRNDEWLGYELVYYPSNITTLISLTVYYWNSTICNYLLSIPMIVTQLELCRPTFAANKRKDLSAPFSYSRVSLHHYTSFLPINTPFILRHFILRGVNLKRYFRSAPCNLTNSQSMFLANSRFSRKDFLFFTIQTTANSLTLETPSPSIPKPPNADPRALTSSS